MGSRVVSLFLVVVSAVGLAACSPGGSGSRKFEFKSANAVGTVIPASQRKPTNDFTAKLFDGEPTSLGSYAGKVVLVNFWAQWCGPCTVETPQLDQLYRQDKTLGVDVLGIDTKDQSGAAKAFVKNHDITFPMVSDEEGRIAVAFGNIPASGLPFSVLLDKQSHVAAVYLGPVTPKDVQPALTKLLSET